MSLPGNSRLEATQRTELHTRIEANPPMRIAFPTDEFLSEQRFDGGLANYLFRVAVALKSKGHHPIILVAANREETLDYQGLEVHRVDLRRGPWMKMRKVLGPQFAKLNDLYLRQQAMGRKLRQLHAQTPIDLIQFPSWNPFLWHPLQGQIPIVVRISSYTPLVRRASERKRTWHDWIFEYLEARAMGLAQGLFCPSRRIGQYVQDQIKRPVHQLLTPYVPPVTPPQPQLYQCYFAQKPYLLFFGTLGILKGVRTIAESLPALLATFPDLHFGFVGKDDGFDGLSMLHHLRQKAKPYSQRIIYIPKLRHAQLYPIIEGALAVVLPSVIDNHPNACLESFALGKTVIGTRGSSLEELIQEGENGFLVPVNDSAALFEKLCHVINLPGQVRAQIGARAQQSLAKFDPQKVIPDLIDFYQAQVKGS